MKPIQVARIHKRICENANCRFRDKLDYEDECASCPNGHWGRYNDINCDKAKRPLKRSGLGDKVEKIAQPIARVIDAVLGTRVEGCGGCKQMKNDLNSGMSLQDALRKRIRRK